MVVAVGLFLAGTAIAKKSNSLEYEIKAKDARLIRQVTGEVTSDVQGIPASPVDSFLWDGEGIVPIKGSVKLKIDPVNNTGEIKAKWKDADGNKWEYKQTSFTDPGHPTGLRVGPGANDTELITGDPVVTNVYLHGNTTAGAPVLPTNFNLLATWGEAEVKLNGQPFVNPFGGPSPLWAGHTMLTVGLRNEDGQVLANEDGTIYNPSLSDQGVTYDDQIEFHLVFDAPPMAPDSGNIPPLSFFYHVTFSDIELEVEGS